MVNQRVGRVTWVEEKKLDRRFLYATHSTAHCLHPRRLRRPDREQPASHRHPGRDGAGTVRGAVRQLPISSVTFNGLCRQ
jgi:hypothetical protein